jgi:hypothetical protein
MTKLTMCGSWEEFSDRYQRDYNEWLAVASIENICEELECSESRAQELKDAACQVLSS